MKTYKLLVELYIYAEDQEEAESVAADELDYLCGCDNQISAFEFEYHTATEEAAQ